MFGAKDLTPSEKEPIKRHVLKLGEMMLRIDDDYADEVGNSSYNEKMDMFQYDPSVGLLIATRRGDKWVSKDDLVRISSSIRRMGHITVDELFGGKAITASERDFQTLFYSYAREFTRRLEKLDYLFRLFKGERGWEDIVDKGIESACQENEYWTLEEAMQEICKTALDCLHDDSRFGFRKAVDEEEKLHSWLKKGGFFLNFTKPIDIVHFFGTYHLVYKAVNPQSTLEEAFREFNFTNELMDEFDKSPDLRFGDDLLLLCQKERLDRVAYEEEQSKLSVNGASHTS